MMKKYVILHNIRSAHNVGSIFRTSDGAGVSKIYLTGYTPTPTDRFGRTQLEIVKTSLGASENIEWEQIDDIFNIIKKLQKENIEVVAVEQSNKSVFYKDFKQTKDTAYIFGNEIDGLSEDLLNKVDIVVEISMAGKKESLNVSVSVGIILFQF